MSRVFLGGVGRLGRTAGGRGRQQHVAVPESCRIRLFRSADFRRLIVWPAGCISSSAVLQAITGQLERYMDLLSARQKLVASNVANADTPGYRTQDFDFQSEFLNATGGTPHATEVAGLAVK